MKKKILISTVLFLLLHGLSNGQEVWTQKADFGGGLRGYAVAFSIGTKGYILTGADVTMKKDLWEWDQTTNVWTQKADFPGTARDAAVGFSIGNKGYIGLGGDFGGIHQDFWEWDQATNIWTQKANYPGTGGYFNIGFSIGTKGYIGTGADINNNGKTDFWEWDQGTNVWTQKANFGGVGRWGAVGFSIGTKGYIGTGYDGNSYNKDFWEWDQTSNVWSQKADFRGGTRGYSIGFSIDTKGYIGTGADYDSSSIHVYNDFYEYNPNSNIWVQKANFGGDAREYAVGFSIGGKGYIGTGGNGTYKDFWEYNNADGINELENEITVSVFPNPFSSTTTLQTSKIFKNATLTICNSFGQQIIQIKNIYGHTITLHRDNLPSGLYFIRMTQDNKTLITDKLIITDN